MAQYDSADLVARCVRYADRPATDRDQTPDDWYAWLSEAQDEIVAEWASMPYAVALQGEWTVLHTADDGRTYLFPGRENAVYVVPLGGVLVKPSATSTTIWTPGAEWDPSADFVLAGDRIRFPRGKSWNPAPVARYIAPPLPIDANSQPLLPTMARMLLVWRALQKWARKGGARDPQPYIDGETQLWYGRPEIGQHGLLGALQKQFLFSGAVANARAPHWTHLIDTGEGYPGRPLP